MLRDWFLYNNSFCAVEHVIDKEGKEIFNCLQLTKKRKELIVKNCLSFEVIDELFSFLKQQNQKHVVLVVNNQQILSKPFDSTSSINSIFPNLSLGDFYHQVCKTLKSASLVRKDYLDELINLYQENKVSVLDVSLGNMSVVSLLSLVEDEVVFTSNTKITNEGGEYFSSSKVYNEKTYTINELSIKSNFILSLGAIVDFYLKGKKHLKDGSVTNYTYQVLFNKGYKASLLFCFAILLVNFLFFNSYYTKVTKLNSHIELYRDTKNELKELQNELQEKEKLVAQIQGASSSNISKYIDQIIYKLPSSILLSELNFQPFTSSIKEGKEIKNELNQLVVTGTFKNNEELSKWIDAIENLKWVTEVHKLLLRSTKKNAEFNFSIAIKDEL